MSAASAAMQAGRWDDAEAAFRKVIAQTGDPWAYDGLAQVAWWKDDADTALTAREAAYRGFRAVGDDRAAARAASTLGYDSILFGRGVPIGRGWLGRAADLLAGTRDVPEAGWLSARLAEVALTVDHDARAGLDHAQQAEKVGRETGDRDLVFVAQALAGLSLVRLGKVAEGMGMLDAAATAATAGDITDLMWMGKVCCWLINACQDARDLSRASTWCTRVEEICVRHDLAPLFSVCRTQYASVLLAQGDTEGAESTLADVMRRWESSKRTARLEAVAQLGELRRRQGRYAEAEQLLRQAGFQPNAVIGLARIRLAQGDPARAWSTMTELVRAVPDDQQLGKADVLAAVVEIGLAADAREQARTAAAELREMADRVGTAAILASAAVAAARLSDGTEAEAHWQDAVRHAAAAGLAFDEAESRLGFAEFLIATGQPRSAHDQAVQALELLVALDAGPGITRAHAVLGHGRDEPLTRRQLDVLRLLARGMSNTQIAAELFLSEHTVHRHIANIYAALDIRSRAEAAAYAVSRGLIRGTHDSH